MGSSESKPSAVVVSTADSEKFPVEKRIAEFSNLTLNDTSVTPSATLDTSLFSKWEARLLSDPKNQLALSAFTQADMLNIIRSRDAVIHDGMHFFSHKIEAEGNPVTNQRSSGRCWLFASTNVMRVPFMKKYSPIFLWRVIYEDINFQNFNFRNNICFFGINWRKQIVLSLTNVADVRFLGVYD
jgi:bleomycin hydrolase